MNLVAITTSSFAEYDERPLGLLKKSRLLIRLNPYKRKLKGGEVLKVCRGANGIIAGTEKLDKNVLSRLPGLKVISRCGTGVDNVDIDAARDLGIRVFATPDVATTAVAELTLALILNLLRKVSRMDRQMRKGIWDKPMGNLLTGKKIGIIGYGRIGQKVAELLQPFGCKIVYADPRPADSKSNHNSQCVSLRKLLKESDIITLHAATKDTLLTKREFALLKCGSWLINVSRGSTLDEKALARSLKDGRLAGAALDVFKEEPYHGKLRELQNVVLTCHVGSYAKETRVEMELEAAKNLLAAL